MRNISFFLTTDQVRNRTKTVTRRLGWKNLKPGTLLCAVRKCQGLKAGEKVEKLATIKVKFVTQEPLRHLTQLPYYGKDECEREGFPDMSPEEFIEFFCKAHKDISPDAYVTRIEFEYAE